MTQYLIDLDELALRCWRPEAQRNISEAIACYRVGAFRACIVMTWIAVFYDFIDKLRLLEQKGDKNAKAKLEVFEKARQNTNYEQVLEFERQILTWARDEFGFLSQIQHDDLVRLREDRNRCAHPSMVSSDERYEPSAEVARYHLRNAFTHLLEHAPIQGKSAIDALEKELEGKHFPNDVPSAIRWFRQGPLSNPKPVLIRNFVSLLIKSLLADADALRRSRFATALEAVRQMHRIEAEKAILAELSQRIARLSDEDLRWAVQLLLDVSDTWQYLKDDACLRLESFVLTMDEVEIETSIDAALDLPELKEQALRRLVTVPFETWRILAQNRPRIEYVRYAIALYGDANSFARANEIATAVLFPLVPYLTNDDITSILGIAVSNSEVRISTQLPSLLKKAIAQGIVPLDRLVEMLRDQELHNVVAEFIDDDENRIPI